MYFNTLIKKYAQNIALFFLMIAFAIYLNLIRDIYTLKPLFRRIDYGLSRGNPEERKRGMACCFMPYALVDLAPKNR